MSDRQTYSIDQIKHMLIDRLPDVAYYYARPCSTSYEDKGLYFTLNPGRADKTVGSFYIHLRGDRAGRWRDHATGDYGDLIDLIKLYMHCSDGDAIREARTYLGLETDSPEDKRRREEAIERSKELQKRAAEDGRRAREKKEKMARQLLHSAQQEIMGTPVEWYLRHERGIDFEALGRVPRSLRYHPDCYYKHTCKETGKVVQGRWPAMLAPVINRAGKTVACHRTYLARDERGAWGKAPVPKAKKVLGEFGGSCIRLWTGTGPRGGKGAPLSRCPAGTHVFMSEGIEDALSGAMLLPDARFLAGISLGNLGFVELPENVASITLIGDRDEHAENKLALQRAGERHRDAGRKVYLWQNRQGGKDLNDALRATQAGAEA